jgi:TatD DNase family protein
VRAAEAGVGRVITIGTDLGSSATAVDLAVSHAQVWAAVGVHPHDAESFDPAAAQIVERLARHPRVVAVGETGMDFYRNYASRDAQVRAFGVQIEIAKRVDKALVMHIREAFDEVLTLLKAVGPPPRLVFHCFSGDTEAAAEAVGLGGYISFAGNVSYRHAEPLREAARAVPMNRLLVETDSPYLAPMPYRGKPNEPSYVPRVGEAVAAALGRPVEEVATATRDNALAVFGLES